MTDTINLSLAELAFLIAVADPERKAEAVPTLLGINPDERTDAVKLAGLASLVLREHARLEDEQVVLTPTLAAIAAGLTSATTIIELGLVSPTRAGGTIVFDSSAIRLLVSPRAPRCAEVVALAQGPMVEPLAKLVREFLTQVRPGVASLRFERGAAGTIGHRLTTPEIAAAPGFEWVTIGVGPDGGWSIADATEPTARRGTETEILARFAEVIDSLAAAAA